jgi:hypothetical protein
MAGKHRRWWWLRLRVMNEEDGEINTNIDRALSFFNLICF